MATTEEWTPDKAWLEAVAQEELDEVLQMQDWRSWLSLLINWGLVAVAMALVAVRPNPLTIIVSLFIIGARQLGLTVLMHEAAHWSLLSDKGTNDWVANWLCAYPAWADLRPYRAYHLQHHAKNWTEDDPDIALASPFPITRASMRRKVWRDLSGQTGWKRAKVTLRRDLGDAGKQGGRLSMSEMSRRQGDGASALVGMLVTNSVLFLILAALGHPTLYLLWAGAWITTYSLVMRIRAIAEHSMPRDRADHMTNTRTTVASWWERLFLAPNRVNYHLEHHLLVAVPHYKLPAMHRMLGRAGLLENASVAPGYFGVLRLASSKT